MGFKSSGDIAMPPQLLKELGEINNKESGIVENYIYNKLKERLAMISNIIEYINSSGIESFDLDILLSKFTQEPGLKRSVDKIYEIITYALFNTIVRVLKIEVSMGIKNIDREEVENFSEFVKGNILKTPNEESYTLNIQEEE